MAYSRKQLKKLYPDADENYLMLMLDGKIYSYNYMLARKKEIYDEFDKYYTLIYNVFANYLISKKRDYFTTNDYANINKKVKRKIVNVITDFYTWVSRHFVESMSEFYNYKILYDLWMFEVVGEKFVAGEMSRSFDSNKVSKLLNRKQYGYGYVDRLEQSISLSNDEVDSIIRGITTKDNATLEDVKRLMNRRLKKHIAGKMANAESIGLEDIDIFAESEAYENIDINSAFGGSWVRVEILDRKTCITCASIDGKVSKMRYGSIHPNCRGVDVPCKLSDDKVNRLKDKLNRESKRIQNFDSWFSKLSEKDKKRVLGKKKYLQYKSGKKDIHQLVKSIRVDGIKTVKSADISKLPKSLVNNPIVTATRQLKYEYSRLPVKKIENISTIDEYKSYERYLGKKELLYRNLKIDDLRKAGIKRKSLLDEVFRERKHLTSILRMLK